MAATSEQDLAAIVVGWLTERGWDVYQEVAIMGKVADIVAVRGPCVWIVECKVRLDRLMSYGGVVDLKTSTNSTWPKFRYIVEALRYDFQGVFYEMGRDATAENGPVRGVDYQWLVVSRDPPHLTIVHTMGAAFREIATQDVRMALNLLKQCREADSWPEPRNMSPNVNTEPTYGFKLEHDYGNVRPEEDFPTEWRQ